MKKSAITILMLLAITVIYSCKDKKKDQENQQQPTESSAGTSSSAEPKTYTVTAIPDSVSLGKSKEAFIKIKDLKAVELSNPDGVSEGIELTYKLELTNKNAIGGYSVGINTGNFRLELDNGNKIAPSSVYVNAEPEATKLSDNDTFKIPAGAKPVALFLFYEQTRASVKLEMK